MTNISDIRAVNYFSYKLLPDADGIIVLQKVITHHTIEIQRDNSEEWVPIDLIEVANP